MEKLLAMVMEYARLCAVEDMENYYGENLVVDDQIFDLEKFLHDVAITAPDLLTA